MKPGFHSVRIGPDWQTNWQHLVADGTAAELTQPSAANETRDFPPPVVTPPA